MSLRTLEAAILRGARAVLLNGKLRQKDILAWSTAPVGLGAAGPGEIAVEVADPGVWILVHALHDRRKPEAGNG